MTTPITAYVINLNVRTDRWKTLTEHFQNIKSIKLERFPAYFGNPGWRYCSLSHQELIRRAADRNDPFVLVMEDDVILPNPNEFDNKFPEIISWLRNNNDWEVFNGGPQMWVEKEKPINVLNRHLGIVSLNWGQGCHFVIYSSRCYNKILEWDPVIHSDTIDLITSKHTKQVTTYPFIAIQRPDYSNIENRHRDYSWSFMYAQTKVKALLDEYDKKEIEEMANKIVVIDI